MLLDPLDASVSLTLAVGVLLLATGALRIVFALQTRSTRGWGWALALGLGTAAVGTIIVVAWPQASLWAIGLIAAVELIVNGWMCVALALAARRA